MVFIVLGILVIVALVFGYSGCQVTEIYLEFKKMSNPYYNIGVSFNRFDGEEVYYDELVIGLFFMNIVAVFHKEK